jgi:predicted ArsR family transcriptional regulator
MKLPRRNTCPSLIIDFLTKGPATSIQIADLLGVSTGEIHVTIAKMRKAGFIERVAVQPANGAPLAVYDLTSAAREAVGREPAAAAA